MILHLKRYIFIYNILIFKLFSISRNGMFLGPALKLCPELKTIQYDFVGYEEVSKILYDTVASYTLDIQVSSFMCNAATL